MENVSLINFKVGDIVRIKNDQITAEFLDYNDDNNYNNQHLMGTIGSILAIDWNRDPKDNQYIVKTDVLTYASYDDNNIVTTDNCTFYNEHMTLLNNNTTNLTLKELVEIYEFFPTPASVVNTLLQEEGFIGNIWEPACGDGAIVKALCNSGVNRSRILASDIYDYGFEGTFTWDFLQCNNKVDNIITGVPYSKKDKFVEHALQLAVKKVALLMPTKTMMTKKRFNEPWTKATKHWVGKIKYHEKTQHQLFVESCWYVWVK